MPFLFFLAIQSVPKFWSENPREEKLAINFADSLGIDVDSLGGQLNALGEYSDLDVDSLVSNAMALAGLDGLEEDSLSSARIEAAIKASAHEDNNSAVFPGNEGPFGTYFPLMFLLTLLSFIIGFIYNRPFKKYFEYLRRGKEVPEKTRNYCRNQLFRTPVNNALILSIPNMVIVIFSLASILFRSEFEGDTEKDLFIQLLYLSLVASVLEFLFVYYWQKHRVHIRYIDHFFTREELRVKVFEGSSGRIRNRFLVASGMTTFLPLLIVSVYLILSFTSVKDLSVETKTQAQWDILLGNWNQVINADVNADTENFFNKLFYVNVFDSLMMLVGIGNGILVSFIYLLLFIRWTNLDITRPVKELLLNIRNTKDGKEEQYTIVRTNDEIGELAEGYNEMTRKIHNYVESISAMNRDLELRVEERTNEVVMQKEEIEAQKEEIEAQLDLATEQRDTISRQKEQILDSIRYAERIQSAILPPVEYLSDYLSDHFVLFKPRDIVSGDYYWTNLKNDKLLVAVADCTGHGVPGAFLSMLGISSMNEIINRNASIKAHQILEQLRNFVIHSLHQTGSRGEAQDGIEIALCIIDTKKRKVEYAGANRPLYLVRQNKKSPSDGSDTHQLIQYQGDRMPIGIYEQETIPFTNHEIQLEKGDALYLFSDGYVDQLGGPSRKTFRSKYFRQFLLQIQDKSMDDQKNLLNDRLQEWRGEVDQIDDILVMGIKI
jgi:serine phosphatase RsbU (regulator of sigma subunit)